MRQEVFYELLCDFAWAWHAPAFQALRLEALRRHACAFAAAHHEEAGQSAADSAARLEKQAMFGGFQGEGLVGVAGFATPAVAKTRHKDLLWGVSVRAGVRGHGSGAPWSPG